MKKIYLLLLASVMLTACNSKNNEDIVEAVVTESQVTESSDDFSINEEIMIDDNLYLTDIVSDVVDNYDVYKDFAIKHGMIYTNGMSTNKSPVMEEIDGYVYGVDELEEDELVYEYYDYDILPLEETDYNKIYEIFKPMTIDEVLDWVYMNCYWYDDYEATYVDEYNYYFISVVGYYGRLSDVEHTKENGYITMEDWETMSEDEQKIHLAKVMVHFNEQANELIEWLNADSLEKNGTVRSVSRATSDDSAEYKAWCLENQLMIDKIEYIDFTVEKEIPYYVTVEDGEYFVTLENLKNLWEEQGSPVDKVLSMQVYGFEFDYDVSNYNFN